MMKYTKIDSFRSNYGFYYSVHSFASFSPKKPTEKMSAQRSTRRHSDNADLPTSQKPCFRHIHGNCSAGDKCMFTHDPKICFPKSKSETKSKQPKSDDRKPKSENRKPKSESRKPKSETKGKQPKSDRNTPYNLESGSESDDEEYWKPKVSTERQATAEEIAAHRALNNAYRIRQETGSVLATVHTQPQPIAAIQPVAIVQSTSPTFNPTQENHGWITGNMNPNDRTDYWFSKLPAHFQQYIQTNQPKFDGMVSHLMDIIFGKVPSTSAAAWLKNLGDRKLIDLSNIQNWTSKRDSFTAAFHYGYYQVFKALYIGNSQETDTGIALLFFAQQFCNYVHVALLPTGRHQEFVGFQFPLQSFTDMSSHAFAGLY